MSCSSAASRSTRSGPGTAPSGPVSSAIALLEHHQRVLVDVLVAVVLVDLEAQRRQLGQHVVGQAGVDQHLEPRPRLRRDQQLAQLVAHPLGRHDRDPVGHVDDRRARGGVDGEAELARRTARRASSAAGRRRTTGAGPPGSAARPAARSREAVERVDERQLRHADRHGVDGEVAAGQVALERVAERDLRLARRRVVRVGAVRGDLDDDVLGQRRAATGEPAGADGAELLADVPVRVAPARQDRLRLVRASRTS